MLFPSLSQFGLLLVKPWYIIYSECGWRIGVKCRCDILNLTSVVEISLKGPKLKMTRVRMIGWQVLWWVNLYVKMIVVSRYTTRSFSWLKLTLLIIANFAKAYVICLLNIEEYGSGNVAWIVTWSPFDEGLSFLRIMILNVRCIFVLNIQAVCKITFHSSECISRLNVWTSVLTLLLLLLLLSFGQIILFFQSVELLIGTFNLYFVFFYLYLLKIIDITTLHNLQQ